MPGIHQLEPQPPRHRRLKLRHWPEFLWLWLTNPTFRTAPDKRRTFLDHRATKKSQRHYS